MSEPDEEFEVNGYTVKIYADNDGDGSGNPRDADNLGVMLANGHRNYTLGDEPFKGHIPEYDAAARILDDMLENVGRIVFEVVVQRFKDEFGATVVLPLYLLDHSGLAMRTTEFFEDPGGWDSGIVGFIFDTTRTRENCGTPAERIAEGLRDEVKYYDMYLQGDVWGYVVEGPDGSDVESCWGFLGLEYCKEEATMVAEHAPAPTPPPPPPPPPPQFGDLLVTHESNSGQRVQFYAWTDGSAIGYRCVHEDGREYYVVLNPSPESDTDVSPDVFVYEGEGPEFDVDLEPAVFVNVFPLPEETGDGNG